MLIIIIKMLCYDNIKEIALHTNLKTTINILRVIPSINTMDFWKQKCQHYFDFWTGPENYLLKNKQFCLNVNLGNRPDIDDYLYEYTSAYANIVSSIKDRIDHQAGYDNNQIIKIPLNQLKQFILIGDNGEANYIGSYYLFNEAFSYLQVHQNQLLNDGYLQTVIVDLAWIRPFFIKHGCISSFKAKYMNFYDIADL